MFRVGHDVESALYSDDYHDEHGGVLYDEYDHFDDHELLVSVWNFYVIERTLV